VNIDSFKESVVRINSIIIEDEEEINKKNSPKVYQYTFKILFPGVVILITAEGGRYLY
jgi:hypothetical protein